MKTKLGIFPRNIFVSDVISFLSKNTLVFRWLSKLKFHSLMTKVNQNDRKETDSDIP